MWAIRPRQCVGSRLRGGSARRGGARRRGACHARRPTAALGHPDRPQGPLRRRGRAPDRVEQPARRAAVAGLRRLGRLRAQGMILLGHLHTHEFACRRDDRPGRQSVGARALSRRIERRLGRGARRAHGARGHGHRHGRLAADPVGVCGTSTIKPTRGLDLDARCRSARHEPRPRGPDGAHAGGLRGAAGRDGGARPRSSPQRARSGPGPAAERRAGPRRWPACAWRSRPASSARSTPTSPTASSSRSRSAGARRPLVAPPAPGVPLDVGDDFFDVLDPELLTYHRRFDGGREHYRPSLREWAE